MSPKPKGKKPDLSSEDIKARLLDVARKHFALHGYAGASLKDIAAEADVAGSLINYHFDGRDGLFKACMEPFARSRMEAIQRILGEVRNRDELRVRIELFVDEMVGAVILNPHAFEILDREVRNGNPVILEVFEKTLLVAFKSTVGFFQQAQAAGLIDDSLDPLILSGMLFATCCEGARKQLVAKTFLNVSFDDPEFRSCYVKHVTGLFMNGVVK